MPARTSPILVKKIRHLRRQGASVSDIARQVQIGRNTVAKYTAKVDDQAELEDVVGGLTAAQQDNLMHLVDLPGGQVEALLTSLATYQCDACGKAILFLASSPGFRCPGCASVMWFKGAAPPASGPTPEQPPAPAARPRLRPIRRC